MLRSLLCAALGGAIALLLPPHLAKLPEPTNGAALPVRLPPELLRAASLGFEAALADGYWLAAIQTYGSRKVFELSPDLAAEIEAATDLDPDFGYAYQFAGLTVPARDAEGRWHGTGAALRILRKGMRSHSRRWQLPFLLGYLLYTYLGEYKEAGGWLREAATRPRAPNYLGPLTARLLGMGGSVETAIAFTRAALPRAPDHWTRDDLQARLKALYLQRDLARLNAAATDCRERGKPLAQLEDLLGCAGLLRLPTEPYGGSYHLAGGKVVSTDDDKIMHLYIHPGKPPMEPVVD